MRRPVRCNVDILPSTCSERIAKCRRRSIRSIRRRPQFPYSLFRFRLPLGGARIYVSLSKLPTRRDAFLISTCHNFNFAMALEGSTADERISGSRNPPSSLDQSSNPDPGIL